MKLTTTFKEKRFNCKFCDREMNVNDRTYRVNPFCSRCYEERLVTSGAIDLRGNHQSLQMDVDYLEVVPVDKEKTWCKKE
ncbi:hypothetical protein SIM22_06320 [Bacillus cereus group sp. BfR-BA-01363]|uniref:hypothetical protein n=1 Tax=Bacillus cereus group sp. BfR-BA-01363 TaxID=3094882 RepID=UPI0029C414EA|nr:hypothetical protein [Bacillus cereus group sp. BfR-BA-01363]MDX5853720.1 hypothetical protein [Bacillus cereus group sp. BfR-BA-01363]